jgi:hypothetical protein
MATNDGEEEEAARVSSACPAWARTTSVRHRDASADAGTLARDPSA